MRILTAAGTWSGGTQDFCIRAFQQLGHEVRVARAPDLDQFRKRKVLWRRLLYFSPLDKWVLRSYWMEFNQEVREVATSFRPDLFFTINETYLWPETLDFIKARIGCPLLCWVADDPFDSVRFTCFPANLTRFTHLFVGEPMWIPQIRMVAKPEVLECLHGGADTEVFHPISVTEQERSRYSAPLSFVGTGYGGMSEGFYRALIVDSVTDYGLKVWGHGWEEHFGYFPRLREVWQGRSASLDEVNIINQVSQIVLSITHPQTFTAMQQRTFEIAASGGFQLADRRTEIDRLFPGGEVVQFSSRDELREMVRYYLDHPKERNDLAATAREIVLDRHTFKHRVQTMLELVE